MEVHEKEGAQEMTIFKNLLLKLIVCRHSLTSLNGGKVSKGKSILII
jgi:hypothetical protein